MHKGSAPTSGCLYLLSAPLLWSHPPSCSSPFLSPSVSLSLSRLRLAARSSAEIHPLSLKFSASWLFRSDKNRGLIRAEIKADWRHSCILPLLHLTTLTIPSSFLRPVVWSWMFNRKQRFEGALFAARTQTQTFSDGRWRILCLRGSEVEVGCFMSRFVWACTCGVKGVLWWWKSHQFFTFTLAFSHPWLPRMPSLPGSLEVCWVCFHTQGAGGQGETKLRLWVWGCVFVYMCTRCLSVQEKENWGREKKSTWPADRAVFSKIHRQEEKKKTRGKNNKPKKTEKTTHQHTSSLCCR